MRIFDTHCHFESSDPSDIGAILARARSAGVEKLMAVGGSAALNASAIAASSLAADSARPEVVCAFGYDREQLGEMHPAPDASLALAAWGEIGLDYHYSPETREAQRRLFAGQLEEAAKRNLPVVIHTREADDDTLAILREVPSRGVIHCYTGSPEAARRFLDLGFYISISGIVTFRAADNVRASALVVPDDRILVETDSPFLAPVPLRGRPNEPAFIVHTVRFLAELRGTDAGEFAELAFSNAERMLS